MKSQTVIVVGGGIGGLATAALLAKDGYSVTVLEKNEQLGGRASRLQVDGFSFDLGPSWYMMPEVFEKFFADCGYALSDFLELEKLDPNYRVFFSDGTHVDVSTDLEKTKALFDSFETGAGEKLVEFLAAAQMKYELAMSDVLYKNIDSPLDMLSWKFVQQSRKLDALKSMEQHVSEYFKSEKLQQIIQYTLVFLGGAPANTPALYSLMSHMDFNQGVFYPKGGFYTVVEAFVALGKKLGVKYKTNQEVSEITVSGDQVTGVKVGKKTYATDAVVVNADYRFAEGLLSDQSKRNWTAQKWEGKTMSPSAFLLFIGYKGRLKKLRHHSLYFGKNWIDHFDQIFDEPGWPQTPSLYINMPSATDPTVAPKGHENLMVLVPISPGLAETAQSKRAYADFIYEYIADNLGVDLKKYQVYEKIFSVTDFEERYHAYKGNALAGMTHTLPQSLFFRPPNFNKHLNNLYYVGANTQPGIGVPICVISADLVRQRIQKNESSE